MKAKAKGKRTEDRCKNIKLVEEKKRRSEHSTSLYIK
jgi:hypothetical protein